MRLLDQFIDSDCFVPAILLTFLVAFLALFAWATIEDAKKWDAFKTEHACRVVAKIRGQSVSGIGPAIGGNGGVAVTSTYIPEKTGWLCDDGITYFR